MKQIVRIASVLAGLSLLSGCARLPFTQDLRDQYNLSPAQLGRIQYYTSGPIVLERVVQKQVAAPTERNRLQIAQAELVRRVNIPEGTPGVAVGFTNDMLEISFEPGKSLFFGSSPAKRKEVGGLYCLLARDWTDRRGTLSYGGETYRTRPGAGGVHLLIDVEEGRRFRTVAKTLGGLTVADREFQAYLSTLTGRTVQVEGSISNAPPPAK